MFLVVLVMGLFNTVLSSENLKGIFKKNEN